MTANRRIWLTAIATGFVPALLVGTVLFFVDASWIAIIVTALIVWICIALERAYSVRSALKKVEAARSSRQDANH